VKAERAIPFLVLCAAVVLWPRATTRHEPLAAAQGGLSAHAYLPVVHREAWPAESLAWETFRRTRVRDLAFDEGTGTLWAATDVGAIAWQAGAGVVRVLTSADGLVANRLAAVAVEGQDYVWFAPELSRTDADAGAAPGVSRLSRDGTPRTFTVADGLPANAVYSIAVDAAGDVWIGSFAGLARRAANGSWQTFTNSNPTMRSCAGYDCSRVALDIAFDGRGGVWYVHPDGLPSDDVGAIELSAGGSGDRPAVRFRQDPRRRRGSRRQPLVRHGDRLRAAGRAHGAPRRRAVVQPRVPGAHALPVP